MRLFLISILIVLPLSDLIATFKPKPKQKANATQALAVPAKKPKPTLAQLAKEISFDLWLLRVSLLIECLSHTLVTFAPATSTWGQAMFIGFTSLSSLASGVSPASNSFALSMMQLQSARSASTDADSNATANSNSLGQLFSALSMMTAVGQTILGVSCVAI